MKKILATIIAFLLYQANHFLRFLADLFVSTRLDLLSTNYSTWYNKYLISAVLNFSRLKKGKVQLVKIIAIETIDTLLIAELQYKGLTLVELTRYVSDSLMIISGVIPENIQLTQLTPGTAKIIFPMVS